MKISHKKEILIVFSLLIGSSAVILIIILSHFVTKTYTEPYYRETGLQRIAIIYKEAYQIKDIIKIECSQVLPVVYKKVPPLADFPVKEKKEKFIQIILPSILIANLRISTKRAKIIKLRKKLEKGKKLTYTEKRFLTELLKEYKTDTIDELLKRLNIVPVSIAIAQAAIESGWGSSRFFTEGNNVYGMWTFKKERKNKLKAKKNKVYLKTYPDILSSVEDYIYSLNVSWAYEKLRFVRLKSTDPMILSNYLEKYSILRKKYVKRVKTVIMENKLEEYDSCKIHPAYIY
ncbi:MAG: mannosyl-glycoprotein endo-beta-N-acetylglucosamidase [Aquificae bacterium]|nr:mannosyl-glycoprotein endo-beta-N-acetylglucosamidase [Aquificota bacterium]